MIPVRDDARRAVRGIIHDRSQSGATVFVEPEETIPLNNELTRLCLLERDEEQRVLGELTDAVRHVLPALAELVEGLGALDLIFARAALAERLQAAEPEVDAGGDLDLRAARHPLLVAQRWGAAPGAGEVVPVDLRVPADRPGLVLSGPNAGGKTVALETAGLLVLMAQAGCHIPAAPGSRVPLADQVLAVIGDEQSLAQDLSTFSSFVRQVREILDVVGPGSLVLLDELGAGTDPIEGAALGAALLEALLDRGARVIVTTHLEPLKVFAQVEPRLQNATVAFDAERLEPTFRLEYGHPGPSHALTIGQRLGLPPEVIARARTHVGEESRRLEALLATLEARTRDAETRGAVAARREAEAATALAAARVAAERARTEARRDPARGGAAGPGAPGRRAAPGGPGARPPQDRPGRGAARGAGGLPAAARRGGDAPAGAGRERRARPAGRGPAPRVWDSGGAWWRSPAAWSPCRPGASRCGWRGARSSPPWAAGPRRPAAAVSFPVREDVARELRLLGLTSDEARAAVEKFLDDAVLAGHREIRLVHGKGTGALRRAVEGCLRGHPLVGQFRLAEPSAGGAGVTVVALEGGAETEGPAPRRGPRAVPGRRASR